MKLKYSITLTGRSFQGHILSFAPSSSDVLCYNENARSSLKNIVGTSQKL